MSGFLIPGRRYTNGTYRNKPTDLWQVIVAISGGIVTLSGAGAAVAAIIQKIMHSEKMSSNVLVCPSKMW